MASGGPILPQQRANAEARIKTLVNVDLKEICKAYGYQVSGTKVTLQARCMEILSDVVGTNDIAKFDELRYRIGNHGQSPPSRSSSKSYPQGTGFSQSHSQSSHSSSKGGSSTQSRLPPGRNYFKYSPFYDVQETLLPLQDLPEMPQNRHTVKAILAIRPETAQLIRNENNLKIMMYCGATQTMSPHTYTDIAFPGQIEVKINDQDVKANFKGLKNKPGSTKPTDVTAFIRKYNGQQNSIQVTYALTTKRYAFAIYLVRYVTPTQLTENLRKGKIIPKRQVLEEMNRANADPDIAATSIRMSLKDPISTMRITLPIRSTICRHNQCFDGAFFMQLQDQAPQWSCPVCSKSVAFDSLCIDKYFEDILNRTPKSIEKVDIEPNGEWTVIKEEEETDQPNGASSKGARAHYDDDFDDELVELDTPPPAGQPTNGFDPSSLPIPFPTSASNQNPFPVFTPPLSSREPSLPLSAPSNQRRGEKRPASSVIDLTASDEEEEEDQPPRPAKRQQTTSMPQNHQPTSYGTPASLPDRRYSSNSSHQQTFTQSQSDQQRPSSMHGVLPPGNIPSRVYNSQSPLPNPPPAFRPSPYTHTQPTWPATTRNAFAPQSPISMMPPAQPSQHYNNLHGNDGAFDYGPPLLPPLNQNTHRMWRNGFGTDYSQSPPG